MTPRFLFSSLNILEFMVQEQQTERASAFIHELASIYRYMLKNEDEVLVQLSEELEFTQKYVDLLQERFTCGFTVEYNIPTQKLSHHVVPCCLQLLVENATKHNIVSQEQPLKVSISICEDVIVVANNLQLRSSLHNSTRKGLESIRRQYRDIANKEISVAISESEFCVKIPLL